MKGHSVNKLKDLNSHQHHCENVKCQVMLYVHTWPALFRSHCATCTEWC